MMTHAFQQFGNCATKDCVYIWLCACVGVDEFMHKWHIKVVCVCTYVCVRAWVSSGFATGIRSPTASTTSQARSCYCRSIVISILDMFLFVFFATSLPTAYGVKWIVEILYV